MERVDKDVAQLAVFNISKGNGDDRVDDEEEQEYGDENEDCRNYVGSPRGASKKVTKPKRFKGVTSVSQLKHLLRNYDALVEGQHALLNQSIAKMAKIPPADEIASTFNRFQILKDSELDEMRQFVNEHKAIMQT